MNLERLFYEADKAGVRLEIVGGVPVWEASPILRHQRKIDAIRATIRPNVSGDAPCACVHYADLSCCFPDGSHKRPDIAFFCREPDEEDAEVTLLPEAVIEILSKGYEAKDLQISVPFYQRMGVKDIVVYDPESEAVQHYRTGESAAREYVSPVEIEFACGCRCTV